MNTLAQLLRNEIGLDLSSFGEGALERVARHRSAALGLASLDQYRALAHNSVSELKQLIEAVVISETWFFRDAAAFAALARAISTSLTDKNPARPFRILSLPCSSGEEPFSIVMALTEAGIPSSAYSVDAVDISARSLEKGRKGAYTQNSFRGAELWFRRRYFRESGSEFVLSPAVIDHVSFHHGNVLDPKFAPSSAPYDFIFCRNLLIYFDVQKRQQTLTRLSEWLLPEGLLFVGAAEQPLLLSNSFRNAALPLAFALRKTAPNAPHTPGPARLAPQAASPLPDGNSMAPSSSHPDLLFHEARRLALIGSYAEAAAACADYLRKHVTSADAWHLLGSIRDALSLPTSLECYRKALYLQPDHEPSLRRLAQLSEKAGNHDMAGVYQGRVKRAQARRTAT
jgi:chemotaxis protein methyltransferase WspC